METQTSIQQETGHIVSGTRTAPVVSTKNWFITIFLTAIPIVNIVLLCVWAFGGSTNPNKSNYAKAGLIWVLIGIVFYVVVFMLMLKSFFSVD